MIKDNISNKRKMELLNSCIGWIAEHVSGEELYNSLHNAIGLSNDEIESLGLDFLKEYFDQAEEHQQQAQETTDLITTEDLVEQAVYLANAPEYSEEQHAENMLRLLGANVVDEESIEDDVNYQAEVLQSVDNEFGRIKETTLRLSPEEIFRLSYKTVNLFEITDFLLVENNCSDKVYKALYEDNGLILEKLVQYCKDSGITLTCGEETAQCVENYCNEFHPEIMQELADGEPILGEVV